MPVTAPDVQTYFKLIGKLAYVASIANGHAEAYKRATMTAVDQGVTGQSAATIAEYDLFDAVLAPMKTNTKSAITALAKLPEQMAALATTYLTTTVRAALGVADADLTSVLDALRGKMDELGLYLQSGFSAYFAATLNYNNLPVAGTTAIPDAWITDAVV